MDKTIFLQYFCLFMNVSLITASKKPILTDFDQNRPYYNSFVNHRKGHSSKKNICIDHKYSLKRGGNCFFCDFMLPQIYMTNNISIELLALKSFTKIIFNDFYTFRFFLHLLCC